MSVYQLFRRGKVLVQLLGEAVYPTAIFGN